MSLRRLAFLLPALCGCGGTVTGVNGGGDGGSSPVTLPDGGVVPTVSCGNENVSSIAGTWDVIGSRPGSEQSTAVLGIDQSSFSFSASGKSLTFAVNGPAMTLVWRDRGKEVPINVAHTSGALGLGLFPLPVGGKWTFASTSNGETCTSSLGAGGFDATCDTRVSTGFGRLEGTVVGQRQQTMSSIFGDLGGVWRLSGNGKGSVVATISGNTFTAVVSGDAGPVGRDGWVTVKVCNGSASGKTSDGFEFAATRQ